MKTFTKEEVLEMIQEVIDSIHKEEDKSENVEEWERWFHLGGGACFTYGYIKTMMEQKGE